MYKVRYYEEKSGKKPISDFMDSAQKSLREKIIRQIAHLEEFGITSENPALRKLSGTPLWEIRILGKDNTRIICVAVIVKEVIILHIFRKKSNKTSPKDLKIALNRFKRLDK